MMRSRSAIVLPLAAAVTGGGLMLEARRAIHAPYPSFTDLDATGAYGPAGDAEVHLALLGDSTLTGPGLASPRRIWAAVIAERLGRPCRITRLAVGGSRVRDVLAEQLPMVEAIQPDVAIVSVGANDALHGTPAFRFAQDLRELLGSLASRVPEVLVFGLGDLSSIPRVPGALRPILAARSAIIDRRQVRVASRLPAVTRVPTGDLTSRIFRERGAELFAPDMFHPNEIGHAVWADAFLAYVQDAVDRLTASAASSAV